MDKGLFVPESHGREHLTVQLWMQRLQAGDKDVLKGFEMGYVSVPAKNLEPFVSQFRPEFYFNHERLVPFLNESIQSGVALFKELFGYVPRAFAPTNGIFHPVFEPVLAQTGVKYLYVSHLMPIPGGKGGVRKKYYPTGKTGKAGLTYYTRNCAFEPTDENYKGIELTLKQIEAAFRWGKPANISTHRVNFVGGLDEDNRAKGLEELKKLLLAIIKNWPEVEFRSSADMFKAVYESRDDA